MENNNNAPAGRTRSRRKNNSNKYEKFISWLFICLILIALISTVFIGVKAVSAVQLSSNETISLESSREIISETVNPK